MYSLSFYRLGDNSLGIDLLNHSRYYMRNFPKAKVDGQGAHQQLPLTVNVYCVLKLSRSACGILLPENPLDRRSDWVIVTSVLIEASGKKGSPLNPSVKQSLLIL